MYRLRSSHLITPHTGNCLELDQKARFGNLLIKLQMKTRVAVSFMVTVEESEMLQLNAVPADNSIGILPCLV